MSTARNGTVMRTHGNVIFCNFGCGPDGVAPGDGPLDETLAGIRATIGEINGIVSETFAAHIEASALEREAAQLRLKALDSMDIVAFQSQILLAGADDGPDVDAATVASLSHFVSAGAALSQRLHALAREHRSWIGAEERVLQDIVADAAQLEATAGACIRAMRGDPPLTDATA